MSSRPQPPKKLSFQEAWESLHIFLVDDDLEDEIDRRVDEMLALSEKFITTKKDAVYELNIQDILDHGEEALEWMILETGLSVEKFLRIVSVLRKIKKIPYPLTPEDGEWSLKKLLCKMKEDHKVQTAILHLLMHGYHDEELAKYIPRYYLELLNLANTYPQSHENRRAKYKRSLIGTYSGRKGYYVERKIKQVIEKEGVAFEQGNSPLLKVNIDFAIPSLQNPRIVIMSSFQETTSSGQSTKARDMEKAYRDLKEMSTRDRQERVFVNFVDGGGWLARKNDFERMVKNCDYFVNFHHISLLEEIIRYYSYLLSDQKRTSKRKGRES